jgi:hypothetical protein
MATLLKWEWSALDDPFFEKPSEPEPEPAPKLYYRLLHDDIWPTTEEYSPGVVLIGKREPMNHDGGTGFWTQLKRPFLEHFRWK